MAIYKPSELHQFLHELGASPNKRLSQNFLIDGNIIRKIVSAADVKPNDPILEIGPGPGSLTQALLDAGASVIAVEKDRLFAQALERLKTPSNRLSIHCSDILTFDLETETAHLPVPGSKAKVIANLPYHLTTPIIAKLVPMHELFSSLTVMVQHEVALRMTAKPGSADYSSFSIFLQFYSTPRYGFTVSRNCFYPSPRVDSAVVVLDLHKPLLPEKEAKSFFRVVRRAFEHRRKMLRASLRDLFPPSATETALIAIGENALARPEELSLEKFLELHAILSDEFPHHEDNELEPILPA